MSILSLQWVRQRERHLAYGFAIIVSWQMLLCLCSVITGDIQIFGDGDVSASARFILVALVGSTVLGLLLGITERWGADDVDFRQGPWAARMREHLSEGSISLLTLVADRLRPPLLVAVKRVTEQHEPFGIPLRPTSAVGLSDSANRLPRALAECNRGDIITARLRVLSIAVWEADNAGDCPPEKCPDFRQLDDLISTTAWGAEARGEFFSRWSIVEKATTRRFEVNSFAELVHLTWEEATKVVPSIKHPLAPLIRAWQSGPKEVQPVRDTDGNLRSDTIGPRIAMRASGGKTDRLYLPPAHVELDSTGKQTVFPGFGDGNRTGRIPVLPVELYDLGVQAGTSRGGHGGAPVPARMLVKLAAAPSTSVRHGERFVTYNITLRDLRDALYPPTFLDGRSRQIRPVSYLWPRVREAIRIINQDARIPVLNPATGYGYYHHLLRINENFGRIDLNMPISVVLDIPPEVEGGVQLPKRLDQWGAESAPAYRALIGLSFLWHEPGRTHAPLGGRWLRKTGPDPYDPLDDDDVIALAYPSSVKANRRELARRAWGALENLEEHGELRIDERRILPPKSSPQ